MDIYRILFSCLFLLTVGLPLHGAERPNIVFIFSDDHALKAISAYGNALNQTPQIDRIAKEGAIFTRSYCTNSICGPSRASILSGMHSHRNGFLSNRSPGFDGSQTTFPKLLQQAGYQTALVGKWHLKSKPTGFNHYEILPGQGNYYNPDFIQMDGKRKRYIGYCTDIVTDRAFDWLRTQKDDSKPFMLMIQHKAPHRTFAPALRHLDQWKNETLPEPSTLFDDYANRSATLKDNEMEIGRHMRWDYDLKVKNFNPDGTPNSQCVEYPRMTDEQKAAWDAHFEPLNEQLKADYEAGKYSDPKDLLRWKYQRYVKNFLRTITAVDENVGRVLEYLEENNLADNTIVIYSSDQGFYLGEHGWYDKRWMFEESFAMPFLIRWPGTIKPGSRIDELIQNIDYAPTFLDIAGAPIPERMQGRSLLPLLKNQETTWRDDLFYAYYEIGEHAVPPHTGIATDQHKLIHFTKADEWNLFDLKADPNELKSFHNDPAYAEVFSAMRKRYQQAQQRFNISPSTIPAARGDNWWQTRHKEKLQEVKKAGNQAKLVFVGDSITQSWETSGKSIWNEHFAPLNAINLGYSGDRTEHVLWRIKNGEWPESLQPETAVVMIGTNNTGQTQERTAEETAEAIKLICQDINDRAPNTRIVLLSIFPRGQQPSHPMRQKNLKINQLIGDLDKHPKIEVHDFTEHFLDKEGNLPAEIMPDALHPNQSGYEIWAQALNEILSI